MIIDLIIFSLAQSFLRAQGLGSAESGIVLLYSEHFGLCRIRRDRKKESPKNKPNWQVAYNERNYNINKELWRSANIRQKNEPNLLDKNLNTERKIDDTKL